MANQENQSPYYIKNERQFGLVCKWLPSKGYGFIRVPEEKLDIYVHTTDVLPPERNNLKIGENVSFFLHTNTKTGRTKAVQVKGDFSGFIANEKVGFTGVTRQTPQRKKKSSTTVPPYQLTPVVMPQQTDTKWDQDQKEKYVNPMVSQQPLLNHASRQSLENYQAAVAQFAATHGPPPEDHSQSPQTAQNVQITVKPEEAQLWETFKQMSLMVQNQPENYLHASENEAYIPQLLSHHFREESLQQPPLYARVTSNDNIMNNWDLRSSMGLMYGGADPVHYGNQAIPTGTLMGFYPYLRTSDGNQFLPANPARENGSSLTLPEPPGRRSSFEWSVRQSC